MQAQNRFIVTLEACNLPQIWHKNSTSDTKNLGVQNSNESQANACLLLAKDIKVEVNEESTQPEEQKKVPYNILENIKQPVEII